MSRTKVIVNPVADTYVNKDVERIIEFSDAETGQGGLIAFRRRDDGTLHIYLYRLDENVRVAVSGERGNVRSPAFEHADPREGS